MKVFNYVLLVLVTILALLAGVAKVMLMEQEVNTFGPYGFSNALLVIFGVLQLLGAIAIALPKFRLKGAAIVAISFIVSAVVLAVAGNIPMAGVTLLFVFATIWSAKQSLKYAAKAN